MNSENSEKEDNIRIILDIGCGKNKYPGSIGIDRFHTQQADVIADMNFLPFKNDCFDKVICWHVLEHQVNIIPTMEEIFRVSKNNAIVNIRTPYYTSIYAWADPTHYRGFCVSSFNHFDADLLDHYGDCNFKIMNISVLGQETPDF